MKGDAKAIAFLQAQLKNELTAINQYFVHYDADPPRNAWREDELSEDDAYSFGSSKLGAYQVLAGLRQRLGAQAQRSNWTPPEEDENESE